MKNISHPQKKIDQFDLIRIPDYFFVLRPMLFFPGWSTLLAGYFITSKNKLISSVDDIVGLDYAIIGSVLFIFGTAMGMSFLLNQLRDIESDKKNKKLFIISEGHISRTAVILEIIILGLIAISGGFLISQVTGWMIIVFIGITGFLYNYKPFILKDRPVGSLVANALMGWLAFALGWSLVRPFSVEIVFDSLPYFLLNSALYLFTILPDVEGDRQASKRTFAVIYGIKPVIVGSFYLYTLSIIASVILKDWQILFVLLSAFPFFVLTIIKKTVSTTIMATKFSILFFALMICLKIPFYFLLMVIIFFMTRWYFRKRFNFDYPNFKGT